MGHGDKAPAKEAGVPEPTQAPEADELREILRDPHRELPPDARMLRFELLKVETYITDDQAEALTAGSAVGFMLRESALVALCGNREIGEVPSEEAEIITDAQSEGAAIAAILADIETEPTLRITVAVVLS